MLPAMRLPVGALALLAVLGLGSPVRGDDLASLRFEREGRVVRTLTLPELRAACHEARIELHDPYHARRKTYLACPLAEVLAAGFGDSLADAGAADFFLRARDGYTKPRWARGCSSPAATSRSRISRIPPAPAGSRSTAAAPTRRRSTSSGPGPAAGRAPLPVALPARGDRARAVRARVPAHAARGEPEGSAAWTGFACSAPSASRATR